MQMKTISGGLLACCVLEPCPLLYITDANVHLYHPATQHVKVHVYELTHHEDKFDLRYRLKEKIAVTATVDKAAVSFAPEHSAFTKGAAGGKRSEGTEEQSDLVPAENEGKYRGKSFLLVTWGHVVLCKGRVLQLYAFSGVKVGTASVVGISPRNWISPSIYCTAYVTYFGDKLHSFEHS